MKLKLVTTLVGIFLFCLLPMISATKNKNFLKSRNTNENNNKNSNQENILKFNLKSEKKEEYSSNTKEINIVRNIKILLISNI